MSNFLYPSLWNNCIVAYCPSKTGPTGNRAIDLSGKGRHGDITDPVWEISAGQYALNMNGSSSTITLDILNEPTTNQFTFTYWIKLKTLAINEYILHLDSNPKGLYFEYSDDNPPYPLWDTTGYLLASDIGTILGRWIFGAMTINNLNIRNYFAGYYWDFTLDGPHESINGPWTICSDGYAANYLDAYIDDIRFYNRGLSYGEIRTLSLARGIAYTKAPNVAFGTMSMSSRPRWTRFGCYPV